MKELKLKARAKINLTLDVTGKRENGYHELEMIMQTLSLYDGITLRPIQEDTILISSNAPWMPTDNRNLAWKAADLMRRTYHIKTGIAIDIDKRIPVAAGLAGGSADCAAVLVGMNRLFHLGLSSKKLEEMALTMGTDIPYCVRRGTVLATGLGEILEDIRPSCPLCYVVLAKPPVGVSTAKVYQSLKWQEIEHHPSAKDMISAIAEGSVEKMGTLLGNVLETVTVPMYPEINKIKKVMMAKGAEGTLMSGSGPTVFGLFTDLKKAKRTAAIIRRRFHLKEVFVTQIYNVSEKGQQGGKKNGC